MDWLPDLLNAPPKRIEVQTVDPSQLDAIRRQWKGKSLLIQPNKDQPTSKEASPDSKYMSDRNIRTDREQRARDTTVTPKLGRPDGAENAQPKREAQKPRSQPKSQARSFPKLGNLGIPIPLTSQPQKPRDELDNKKSHAKNSQPTPQGGQQYIGDKSLPEGSENILNTQESVYYSFYARLYEAIGPIWKSRLREVGNHRLSPGEYTTQVEVIFDQEGNLAEIRQLRSSGIAEFDDAVEKSWRKIQRFPNPPSGLLDRERRVHTGWTFTVNVGDGYQFQLQAPERNY
jgi:TonB family protein